MSVTIEVSVLGEQVIRRRLLRTAEAVVNLEPALARVALILQAAATAQFASDGAFGGTAWAALKPETVAAKRRAGLDTRILRATHTLMDSLTSQGSGHIQEIGPDFLRWGSTVAYGRYHMTGTSRMPARPPLRLPEITKRSAVKALQAAIFGTRL